MRATNVTPHGASAAGAGTRRISRALIVSGAASLALLGAMPALADARIVPGRSVAGVALGDSAAKVKAVLGTPDRGSNVLNYRYIKRHGLGVYFVAGKAFEITVVRGRQATGKRIRIGSKRAALAKAYPKVRCRRAVVGKKTFECRLRSKFKRRATETLFTTRNDRVATIAVHFV